MPIKTFTDKSSLKLIKAEEGQTFYKNTDSRINSNKFIKTVKFESVIMGFCGFA